jgi:hypothetical protein
VQIPVAGHPLHTRSLTIAVTLQEDGRWSARGDVIDLRKCSFVPMVSDIQPAGIVHMMSIEVLLDPATRRLDEIVVDQPFVAVEPSEASQGECCRDPAPRLQALVGEALDADFRRRLSAVFGGPLGCSHLFTLFQLMGSALPRALDLEEALQSSRATRRHAGERPFRRSVFVDGHEAEDGSIDLGAQLADFHTEPAENVGAPLERLARESDARVLARVNMPGHALAEIAGAVRERDGEHLSAPWHDRSGPLAALVGAPVLGGLARRVLPVAEEGGFEPWLTDLLLQLAPTHIQVMAAITERWFGQEGGARDREGAPGPTEPVGGMLDSCYLWRAGGPMAALRGQMRQKMRR